MSEEISPNETEQKSNVLYLTGINEEDFDVDSLEILFKRYGNVYELKFNEELERFEIVYVLAKNAQIAFEALNGKPLQGCGPISISFGPFVNLLQEEKIKNKLYKDALTGEFIGLGRGFSSSNFNDKLKELEEMNYDENVIKEVLNDEGAKIDNWSDDQDLIELLEGFLYHSADLTSRYLIVFNVPQELFKSTTILENFFVKILNRDRFIQKLKISKYNEIFFVHLTMRNKTEAGLAKEDIDGSEFQLKSCFGPPIVSSRKLFISILNGNEKFCEGFQKALKLMFKISELEAIDNTRILIKLKHAEDAVKLRNMLQNRVFFEKFKISSDFFYRDKKESQK